jgi:hypothetical protein
MSLPPAARRALLTTHVLSSVGWVGAVLVYLALGVAAVSSTDTTWCAPPTWRWTGRRGLSWSHSRSRRW